MSFHVNTVVKAPVENYNNIGEFIFELNALIPELSSLFDASLINEEVTSFSTFTDVVGDEIVHTADIYWVDEATYDSHRDTAPIVAEVDSLKSVYSVTTVTETV